MAFFRTGLIRRGVALAAALCLTAGGSGLPMCLSLLAQAASPCMMHSRPDGTTLEQVAVAGAPTPMQGCHSEEAGLGCAAGGACPTGGVAAPTWVKTPVAMRAPGRIGDFEPATVLLSFLAPPPSPPPQA